MRSWRGENEASVYADLQVRRAHILPRNGRRLPENIPNDWSVTDHAVRAYIFKKVELILTTLFGSLIYNNASYKTIVCL